MEASPSGNLGQSVKVHVHLKLYKELTDLNLVQELHSHTGRDPGFNPHRPEASENLHFPPFCPFSLVRGPSFVLNLT